MNVYSLGYKEGLPVYYKWEALVNDLVCIILFKSVPAKAIISSEIASVKFYLKRGHPFRNQLIPRRY